jgi:hypothetical protein
MIRNMPVIALVIGGLLVVLALVGYFAGSGSATALGPLLPGVPILLLGAVAMAKESATKHAMHAAMIFALLGIAAAIPPMVLRIFNTEVASSALTKLTVFGMFLLSLTLLVLGIYSFVQARRERQAGNAVPPPLA